MSTNGAYGFYKNGIDKIAYNHYDSQYDGLGEDIVKFIKNSTIEELNDIFEKIILVNEKDIPTDEDVELYEDYLEDAFSYNELRNWRVLLRDIEGDLELYKEEVKHMIDNKEGLKDSLWCDYGYIINLDTNELEIYRGGQESPSKNRYSTELPNDSGYYNCRLVHVFSLNNIPSNWENEIDYKTDEELEIEFEESVNSLIESINWRYSEEGRKEFLKGLSDLVEAYNSNSFK